jgi:mannose-6-phosphate isomerase-like protein (cupin superfamily)
MKQKLKKITMWTLSIIAIYLVAGLIIHYWIVPVKTPDYGKYFEPGKSFHSKLEGMTQRVVKIENDQIICDIEIAPHASGPIAHIHENFEESFTVKSGTLSMQYGTEIKKLSSGQTIVIPKNTAHKPFNETDSVVIVSSKMPLDFAYCLSQIYPFWDENQANTKPPKVLFQLAVYGSKFDSYPTVDAPPKPILKTLKFILAPTARLMGYQFFNESNRPK